MRLIRILDEVIGQVNHEISVEALLWNTGTFDYAGTKLRLHQGIWAQLAMLFDSGYHDSDQWAFYGGRHLVNLYAIDEVSNGYFDFIDNSWNEITQ